MVDISSFGSTAVIFSRQSPHTARPAHTAVPGPEPKSSMVVGWKSGSLRRHSSKTLSMTALIGGIRVMA